MSPGPANARLRKAVRRHVQGGWQRAVFARPQGSEGPASEPIEEVVEGPAGPPSPAELEALLARAEAAAAGGRVKQTFVVDDRTRVRIDARHGRAKVQTLDDATVDKMMGGKQRPLRPDRSADLLRLIGIMNADGTISAKHAKKYKQVNHFVEICRPIWERIQQARTVDATAPLRIADLGCGNAYLMFVLAEALRLEGVPHRMVGVDRREDVIARARERAAALAWEHLSFHRATIDALPPDALGGPPDWVMSLHACDTATDDALAHAIRGGATCILSAPCCQHELAEQLGPSAAPVPALVRQGLLRQDYAALLTDALRVELLEASGYRVDTVEFVTTEHSAKNLLLRAWLRPGRPEPHALAEVAERCAALGVRPALLRLLQG